MDPVANLREQKALLKRLEKLLYQWPKTAELAFEVSATVEELAMFTDGMENWIELGGYVPTRTEVFGEK